MELKVAQHHIDAGLKGDPARCAVALAVREQLGLRDSDRVSVSGFSARVTRKRLGLRKKSCYRLNPAGQSWVSSFDAGHAVPATITLQEMSGWN